MSSASSTTSLYPTTLAMLAPAPHYHLQEDELWKISDHWSSGLCPQTPSLDVDNTTVGLVPPESQSSACSEMLGTAFVIEKGRQVMEEFFLIYHGLALEPGPRRHLSWERSPVPSHPGWKTGNQHAKEAVAFGFISLTLLHPLWPALKTKHSRKGHTVKGRLSSGQGWPCEEERRQV